MVLDQQIKINFINNVENVQEINSNKIQGKPRIFILYWVSGVSNRWGEKIPHTKKGSLHLYTTRGHLHKEIN